MFHLEPRVIHYIQAVAVILVLTKSFFRRENVLIRAINQDIEAVVNEL
jgi:hypothetical protein